MRKVLFVLLLCVVVAGFYRGWFSFSSNRDTASNKVDLSLTVDPEKAKNDVYNMKEKTSELGDRAKDKVKSENQ